MKWIISATGLICAFTLQSAMAALPVTISDPSPAITKWYNLDSSTTITYTITNNVPGHSFPLTVSGLSGALQQVTASESDCGHTLAAGPSTCHIAVEISPRNLDLGEKIHQVLAIDYNGRGPVTKDIQFSVPPALMAAGSTSSSNPAFYSSTGGREWETPETMTSDLPDYGILNDTSCTGSGIGTLCLAAGQDYTGDAPPLLFTSVNGAATWYRQRPHELTATGFFYGTSCTGYGNDARCIAVGEDTAVRPPPFSGNQPPLIITLRREDGNNWIRPTLTDVLTNGVLWAVGCTGSGDSAICTAVGEDYTGDLPPLLLVSTNGGDSWTRPAISDMPASGYFNSASCTGSGETAVCVAAGQDYDLAQPPFLYVSTDGAGTWTKLVSSDLPSAGVFWNTSCTGDGSDAVCTAVGEDYTGSQPPLLFISRNGGKDWVRKTPSTMTVNGAFWATSCTGSGIHAVCTAAGQDNTGNQPALLFVSKDGADSWTHVAPTGLPVDGYIDATSCTGSGATAICTATGQDYADDQPAIIFENKDGVDSMDQSGSWVKQTLPDTVNGVILIASGASGAGSSSNSGSDAAGKGLRKHK